MDAGEVASQASVSTLLGEAVSLAGRVEGFDGEEQMAMLSRWVELANTRVVDRLAGLGATGGTTLVCGFAVDRRLVICHVGDSRAYLFRGGECTPLTRDHSLPMMLVQLGEARAEEVRTHPARNRVTRSLGERDPLPDWYIGTLQTTTGHGVLDLEPGDVVLLCSDGLWEPVIEEEMLQILADHPGNLSGALAEFVDRVLDAGAPDNATAVLFEIRSETDRPFRAWRS